ncbi:isocitrate lyase [Vibrio renipiscarius]|uniref:Isocitrate lyase n=1 Tax=Vibrio renipiscarius TaxID=1461322 RepID=A0A0C2NVM4_9VIBR|nr:isocitrate lyase [Vibrio renipiscarius]KII79855.1 isocitrate lyase [Vibrio renipiscarius]KII80170.1 isocitrate lyase [Vibrio renipiscarius]
MTLTRRQQIEALEQDWASNPRWQQVKRPYSAEEVVNLRGSMVPENTIAQRGADKLWSLVNGDAKKGYVNCLGALTGGQAVQQAKAGIEAIYLSGWQVAADNNTASTMYPDQSLYPVDSVPSVVKRINNSFRRADQIQWTNGKSPDDEGGLDYFLPIVADAEAGFGGVLNAYELMKSMIEAGAAGVHFEDQLASVKKCGHMGGKVLVPTQEAVQKLVAARLAADVAGTTTLVIARTDANAADLLTSDCDPYDKDFIEGERTAEGFYRVRAGIDQAISRGLAYAPYADLIWCETAKPCLEEARKFAEAIHAEYPDQLLAYNCSPSFNWEKNLDSETIAKFQQALSDMGYKYQFITLAGIHNMWFNMFELAHAYAQGEGMRHYVEKVQRPEFEAADKGYTFVAHQQEVGTGYFDKMTNTIQGGNSSVTALTGSTEEDQF